MITRCPLSNEPMNVDDNMCYECGCFVDKPEFIATDLYNYKYHPQRMYQRLDHFKEVLGRFQGCEGKHIPSEILQQIRN